MLQSSWSSTSMPIALWLTCFILAFTLRWIQPMKTLRVKVKPNAKRQQIQTAEDGSLQVSLTSPPVQGRANAELIKLLAEEFQVPRSYIQIKSGLSSKQKIVEIHMS
jgi:uncharacterized protein